MRLRIALVLGSLLLIGEASVFASERSERLVAEGEVAYREGRWDEAEERFRAAVEADPDDPVARYQLGLSLMKKARFGDAIDAFQSARRLRPGFEEAERALVIARARADESAAAGLATKRWELRGLTGVQYDSNVKVEPGGQAPAPDGTHDVGDRDDAAFIVGVGGQYDLVRRTNMVARLEYDFYQTLHPDLDDFDFRSHRVQGTASGQLVRGIWAGIQGGYDHYSLGTDPYLSEPWVMPFVSLPYGDRSLTQLTYRYGAGDYLSSPFNDQTFDRDGATYAVGAIETLFFGPRSLTFGYQYEEERPRHSDVQALRDGLPSGSDYRLNSHQGHVGVAFPGWWKTDIDLVYLFRYDDYTELNSQTLPVPFTKRRHDPVHELAAGITRPVVEHVRAGITYYGTFDNSNIDVFSYDRHIVSAVLTFTY